MKKLTCILLVLALSLGCGISALADGGRFSHFLVRCPWTEGQFEDAAPGDWFYESLVYTYRMGLIKGVDEKTFSPGSSISLAETIKLAASINRLFNTADDSFESSEPWYRSYVDYALQNRLIGTESRDYSRPATRAEFAAIMARALPARVIDDINYIPSGSIPDVDYSMDFAGPVYMLYRAGILTGCGEDGSFRPDETISRAEAVVITGRLLDERQRVSFTLPGRSRTLVDGEMVFAQCSDAVFYMEMLDAEGRISGTASGFFIDSNGTAVTCWHAISKGSSARITIASSGAVHQVEGVYDFSVQDDWALIKVEGENFDYLEIGDNASNTGGATVYALGSPLGLQNTITQGLICNPLRQEEGVEYILFSAAISSGSSGGALINKYGQVIGITAATYVYGQNLNLAVNISYIDRAMRDGIMTISDAVSMTGAADAGAESAA